MTTTTLAIVVLGTCCGGFIQGMSGFAFGLVSMSIWVWSIEPRLAAPMVVWGSWVGQILSFIAVRRRIDWRRVVPFVLGGALGVPLGAWLLRYVDVLLFRHFVGVLLLVYCSIMLAAKHLPAVQRGGRVADGTVGWIGGLMGGLGGLTGPAPTLWCTLRGWDKDTQRGIFGVFNLTMHSLTLTSYAIDGTLTVSMMPILAMMVPVAIVPTFAGGRLYRRFSQEAFRRLVLWVLLGSGIALLVAS
ncbi:MAG: sulfite exporter TauE/SafE family protein [Acetobacteraceae bacterium]